MKNYLLTLMALLCALTVCGQEQEQENIYDKLFKTYTEQSVYKVDGDNIVVTKIVENIPNDKDEIYSSAKAFLARAYNNSKSVIQTDSREDGLIVCKGLFSNITSLLLAMYNIDVYYILRIDIKDGKARIICSASTMTINSQDKNGIDEFFITQYYPITKEKYKGFTISKNAHKRAFVKLLSSMKNLVESTEKALLEGGTLNVEKEDW